MALAPDIETKRRMLKFRAQRRGFREVDLLFGAFADSHLPQLDAGELELFEALLAVPDWQIYGWIVGHEPVPLAYDTSVLARLRAYRDRSGTSA